MRKQQEAAGRRAPRGEHISEATPEVREIRELNANITRLINTVRGAVGAKPVKDEPKKYLMADAAAGNFEARLAKHKAIVARMLPKRTSGEAESPTARDVQQEQ